MIHISIGVNSYVWRLALVLDSKTNRLSFNVTLILVDAKHKVTCLLSSQQLSLSLSLKKALSLVSHVVPHCLLWYY